MYAILPNCTWSQDGGKELESLLDREVLEEGGTVCMSIAESSMLGTDLLPVSLSSEKEAALSWRSNQPCMSSCSKTSLLLRLDEAAQ